MKHKVLILSGVFFLAVGCRGYSQARSGLSIGYGINQPYPHGYEMGRTGSFQVNIKVSSAIATGLGIGFERIRGKINGPYNGYYFLNSRRSVGLVTGYLHVKYFFNQHIVATAEPAVYLGGEELSSSGLGGRLAAGYNALLDRHTAIEFAFFTDILPVFKEMVPVAGLKATLAFNFGKK